MAKSIAIAGVTGAVGQEFLKVLAERSFPFSKIKMLASERSVGKTVEFKDKTWYRFRIRVSDAKIETWIDDKRIVNQLRKGHKIGIRDECDLCKPLGIATWDTSGAVRNMRGRHLTPAEVKTAAAAAKEEEL